MICLTEDSLPDYGQMMLNKVAEWRKQKGVSKAHMARQIGVERSYMTKLEQGRIQPTGEKMLRIAEYLKQPVEAVFMRQKVRLTGDIQFSRPVSARAGNQTTKPAE